MMRTLGRRLLVVFGLMLLILWGPAPGAAPPAPRAAMTLAAPRPASRPETAASSRGARLLTERPGEFIYIPAGATERQPLTVLIALHGIGGDGRSFCRDLLSEADQNGWIVAAPTIPYSKNWHDPATVLRDDVAALRQLNSMLDELPARTGLQTRQRVLLYGFSRGAQLAHRFALAYPRRVRGVATLSAGSYTLPLDSMVVDGERRTLAMPFGVADLAQQTGEPFDPAALRRVSFWVGVGGSDTRASDVPAAWTPYLGPDRVRRAEAFAAALRQQDTPAALTIFPGADHRVTPAMLAGATRFLRELAPDA